MSPSGHRRQGGRRRLPRSLPFFGAAVWAVAASPGAAEPRFETVRPGAAPGAWSVTVRGAAAPRLAVDGAPVAATFEHAGDDTVRAVLTTVPAAAGRLEILDGEDPVAAVPIGAGTPAAAPFNDRVVYHIMVGFFANGAAANDKAGMRRWTHRRYAGGDLQGVLGRADYLADLGISDVWLSPIFQSETSHGYDVQDYFRIGDARAVPGDREASLALFRELVEALRERGVGVILDLPLDYGAGSYDRRAGDPNRRRPKSTKAKQEAEKVWESWGTGFRYWNFADADTRLFLTEVALHWLVTEGIAGYRLDYVRGVDHDFWAELYAELKAARPDAFIFGEAWQDAHGPGTNMGDIAKYYAPVPGIGPQFDSLIEFPLKIVMTDVFARGEDARQLEDWLQATAAAYGGHGHPIYFLDSHDMSRFGDWATAQGRERLLAAVGFMATLPGPMILFYGTETGLTGGTAQPGFTDSGRIPMPWDDLDETLIGQMKEIVAMKRSLPVLQRGARLPLLADESAVLMARRDDSDVALVAVNTGLEPRTLEFAWPAAAGRPFEAVLNGAPEATDAPGAYRWTLPPLTTAVALLAPSQ